MVQMANLKSHVNKLKSQCQNLLFLVSAWTEWGSWGDCSLTCGEGEKIRHRRCEIPGTRTSLVHATLCPDSKTDAMACNKKSCPEAGEWTPWSACSKTCGTGERTRTRECNEVDIGGRNGEHKRRQSRIYIFNLKAPFDSPSSNKKNVCIFLYFSGLPLS
jgi:hypothetical protein